MRRISYKKLIEDYNNFYHTNVSILSITTLEIESILDSLYEFDYFDIEDEYILLWNN